MLSYSEQLKDNDGGIVSNTETRRSEVINQTAAKKHYACHNCNKSFHDLKEVLVHRNECAGSVQHWRCDYCNFIFKSRIHLLEHITIEHTCRYCEWIKYDGKSYRVGMINHLDRHLGKLHGNEFICRYCNCSGNTREVLVGHLWENCHREVTMHECCGEKFPSVLSQLEHYLQQDHSIDPCSCEVCGDWFVCKSDLANHITFHEIAKNGSKTKYQCQVCLQYCSTENQLMMHKKIFSKDIGTQLRCQTCSSEFCTDDLLQQHRRIHSHHKSSHIKLIECSLCGQLMANRKIPSHHLCVKLNIKDLETRYNVNNSSVNVLKQVEENSADIEDTRARNEKSSVLGLMSSILTGKLISGEAIRSPPEEKTDNKSTTCSICGRSFNTNRCLLSHQSVHTGEKPYKCKICGKPFRIESTLNKHYKIKHNGKGLYTCDICEKAYSRESKLEEHITRAHKCPARKSSS